MNINKYKYKRNSYATRGIWNLSSDYSVLNLCNRHFSNTIIINQPESPDEQIDRHLREVGEATPAAPTPNVSTSEVLTPGASDRAPNLPIPSSVNEEEGQQEASEQETAVERQIRLNREAAAAAEVARQAALAPRIEDPLLPSLHEFNVVKQNESLVEDAKTMFEHQHKYSNRYVIPDNELSHFKDKQNASELKSIKEAYIYYSTRFNLSNKIVQAIFSSCRSLSPISESYLKELHQIFISKDDNRELPVVCLAPSRPGSLSKVLYGWLPVLMICTTLMVQVLM